MARDIQLQDVEAKASKLIAKSTGGPIVDRKDIGQLSGLTPFDRRRYALAADLFLPFLISLALNEAVALFGFVIAILSRDLWIFLPYAVVAVVLNVYMLPRLDSLMARCERWRT